MIAFSRILCPVDFSETSTKALAYATALASWYSASLEVLHVAPAFAETLVTAAGPLGVSAADATAGSRQELLQAMQRTAGAAGADRVHPRLLVQEGPIHELILTRVQAQAIDLVVIGTHGRGGFNRLFLGSVAEKVVRTVACPVLTVPPAAPASAASPIAFRNIVCAVDYSPSSRRALQYALDLARQANGRLTVLHVIQYMDPQEPCEHVDAVARAHRRRIIDDARERLRQELAAEPRTWAEIEGVVALNADRAYREILARAGAMEADLVVMGAQGAGGVELMLYGSNTHHVVRAATCPVLTVRAA